MAGEDATGTLFKRDTNGAGNFATVGNVSDISGPGLKRNAIDVSDHSSPNLYKEVIKGMKEGGEVSLKINYRPGENTHADLYADFEEDDLRAYQIVILPDDPDEHTWEFDAMITDLGSAYPVDDKMELDVKIKISGKPTLTPTG